MIILELKITKVKEGWQGLFFHNGNSFAQINHSKQILIQDAKYTLVRELLNGLMDKSFDVINKALSEIEVVIVE